jgi:hypothetical protein
MIEVPIRNWYCPNCGLRDQTREARPHTRFHTCSGLRGLTAPMLPEGTAAKVEAREREDYVGRELVQTDEGGRPVMSVVTTRDEGTDAIVFAPTATGGPA